MGISAGAALALAGGVGLGVAAERQGVKTPGGNIGRSVGVDISGGINGKKLPGLIQPIQAPKVLPTINDNSVKKARQSTLLNLQSRSGRASTLLTSNTFGG